MDAVRSVSPSSFQREFWNTFIKTIQTSIGIVLLFRGWEEGGWGSKTFVSGANACIIYTATSKTVEYLIPSVNNRRLGVFDRWVGDVDAKLRPSFCLPKYFFPRAAYSLMLSWRGAPTPICFSRVHVPGKYCQSIVKLFLIRSTSSLKYFEMPTFSLCSLGNFNFSPPFLGICYVDSRIANSFWVFLVSRFSRMNWVEFSVEKRSNFISRVSWRADFSLHWTCTITACSLC